MIRTFNSTVSNAINREGEFYKALIGYDPFTPEAVIDESDDINCGGLCNELEFVRTVGEYFVGSLAIDTAEEGELETLVESFLDLPRRGTIENDSVYRNRFKFIVTQKLNPRRATKWAILDAISYFLSDATKVQFIEIFDNYNLYFQIRIEGAQVTDDAIFLNNVEQGYLDQNYLGGPGVGEVISYLGELIDKIKAAGVDYDILFVEQNSFTKTSDCIIGTIQMYYTVDARIKASIEITKTIDAVIV